MAIPDQIYPYFATAFPVGMTGGSEATKGPGWGWAAELWEGMPPTQLRLRDIIKSLNLVCFFLKQTRNFQMLSCFHCNLFVSYAPLYLVCYNGDVWGRLSISMFTICSKQPAHSFRSTGCRLCSLLIGDSLRTCVDVTEFLLEQD